MKDPICRARTDLVERMLVQVFGAEIRLEVEPGDFLMRARRIKTINKKNQPKKKEGENMAQKMTPWGRLEYECECDVFFWTHVVFLTTTTNRTRRGTGEERNRSPTVNQPSRPPTLVFHPQRQKRPTLTILTNPVKFNFVYKARSCTSATSVATSSSRSLNFSS
jgi:hypothetical protein